MFKTIVSKRLVIFAIAFLTVQTTPLYADAFKVTVTDSEGVALENALIFLTPKFALKSPKPIRDDAEMRQQNILFAPEVLAVQIGTKVSFPNFDESRHHVYSFSKPKRFELQLYGKDESNSIIFEKAGVVAIGCNIHDNMLAYIYVTEAPFFSKTGADGVAEFSDLETGQYEMTAWHPGIRKKGAPEPKVVTIDGQQAQTETQIRLRRVWGVQRDPDENPY